MNSIQIAGYISGIEIKKENELYNVKFNICDNHSENSHMWFPCYLKTKNEKTIERIKAKKEAKQQFYITGKMFYNYTPENEKTYINILIQNFA